MTESLEAVRRQLVERLVLARAAKHGFNVHLLPFEARDALISALQAYRASELGRPEDRRGKQSELLQISLAPRRRRGGSTAH